MARKLFESYSKSLLKGVEKKEELLDDSQSGDPLEKYKEWMESNGVLELLFSFVSPEGDLIQQDANGVKIVLPKDVALKSMSYYDKRTAESILANAFVVNIEKIDEENNTVYVKSAKGDGRKARKGTLKSRLVGEIVSELKKGHTPRLAGKIEDVDEKRAIVNILNKNILGICLLDHWQKTYCRHLKERCKVGEIYEFDIVKQLPQQKGKQSAFSLSRTEITGDPWDSIPEEYLQKGAVIVVRCVERPVGKTYWWGVSDLLPGIEVQADYTKRCGRIMESVIYKCTVEKVDRERHVYRVVPFALADSDVGDVEKAIRFIDKKTKVK